MRNGVKWFMYALCLVAQSKQLFTKILNTPIYDLNQICLNHHIVLLQKTPFDLHQREYEDVYAIDFSPSDDINDWKNIVKMLLGKTIPGKIRLVYFDQISDEALFIKPLHNYPTTSPDAIQDMDNELYNKIIQWDPKFQLYSRNCQHFGRYLYR